MSLIAIRQERSGKNSLFVTDDFKQYSLPELLKNSEQVLWLNIQIAGGG